MATADIIAKFENPPRYYSNHSSSGKELERWPGHNPQENVFSFLLAGALLQFCYELLQYGKRMEEMVLETSFLISACCNASRPAGLEIRTRQDRHQNAGEALEQ